jgi:hypothetical protein
MHAYIQAHACTRPTYQAMNAAGRLLHAPLLVMFCKIKQYAAVAARIGGGSSSCKGGLCSARKSETARHSGARLQKAR